MYMFKYVTKRLGLMLFTFIIIFTMCFVLIKLLPIPTNALPGQDPEIVMKTLEGRGWITNIREGANGVWEYDRGQGNQQDYKDVDNLVLPFILFERCQNTQAETDRNTDQG